MDLGIFGQQIYCNLFLHLDPANVLPKIHNTSIDRPTITINPGKQDLVLVDFYNAETMTLWAKAVQLCGLTGYNLAPPPPQTR